VRPGELHPWGMNVYRLPQGSELSIADGETALLVLNGSCSLRMPDGRVERVAAGSLLLPTQAGRPDRRVSRALELMRAEPSKRWTVERLARAVGLSRAVLARRFVAACGRSPVRYLTELRLALAVSLLEGGEASLAEIAREIGYASEFAFSRAFKRQHGIAPGRYRRLAAPVLLAA
jgi:transcriptional regulator GlxA family with amidase domain